MPGNKEVKISLNVGFTLHTFSACGFLLDLVWLYWTTLLLVPLISVLTELGFYLVKMKRMYCKFKKSPFIFQNIKQAHFMSCTESLAILPVERYLEKDRQCPSCVTASSTVQMEEVMNINTQAGV